MELEETLGLKATLIPGGGDIFDVTADGKLIYSKHTTGRFPKKGEVVKALKTP